MSWAAITWIHDLPADSVDPTGRQILSQLAYRHDDETDECAPGRPYLVKHTGLSEKTVKNWLPKLENQGWFRSERRKAQNGRTDATQYHLNVGFRPEALTVEQGESDAPQGEPSTPSISAAQGEAATPTRGNDVPRGGGISGSGEGEPSTPQLQDNNKTPTDKNQDPPQTAGVGAVPAKLTFDDFWAAYPTHRKKYRGDVEKIWNKLKPTQDTVRGILAALEAQKHTRDWRRQDGQFVPYPTRWLRAKCWLDAVPAAAAEGAPRNGTGGTDAPQQPDLCDTHKTPIRLVHGQWLCPTCEPAKIEWLNAHAEKNRHAIRGNR